jgi:hypothetical protein
MPTIQNEFNAFGDVYGGTANAPGYREEHKFTAVGPIPAGTAVVYDVANLAPAGNMRGLRVAAPSGVDSMLFAGVTEGGAALAGDEVTVVTYGPAKMLGSAVVAAGTAVGHTALGASKAAGTASATVKNIGYTLDASTNGGYNWVFVHPGVF